MQSYLDHKRSLADRLRMIGSPISDADLQLFILHGLNIEYVSYVNLFLLYTITENCVIQC
jgi:hypothetical protein